MLAGRERGRELAALLSEPLADGLTRGGALRWGALLHDAAKPLTREVRPADGRVTFIGHDALGAQLAGEVLGRLRASARLRAHVAALVRHHLRLGFLVHDPQPLARRTVFAYLRACEPVEVDVTLLSVADRLATRGDRAQESIDAHLRLARTMLTDALRWRAERPAAAARARRRARARARHPRGPASGRAAAGARRGPLRRGDRHPRAGARARAPAPRGRGPRAGLSAHRAPLGLNPMRLPEVTDGRVPAEPADRAPGRRRSSAATASL